MSEIRDRAEAKGLIILKQLRRDKTEEEAIQEILSIPELAIVDREANREFYDEGHQVEVEIPKGWVKEVKDGK